MPVIIVFIAIIVDFGIGLNRRIIFTNAAREAARYASLGTSTDPGDIQQRAVDHGHSAFEVANVEVYWIDRNGDGKVRAGESVAVKINYVYDLPLMGSVDGLFGDLADGVNLSACSDMALMQDVSGVVVTALEAAPCGG